MAVSQHNVRRNMSQWPQARVPRSLMFGQLSHSAVFFFFFLPHRSMKRTWRSSCWRWTTPTGDWAPSSARRLTTPLDWNTSSRSNKTQSPPPACPPCSCMHRRSLLEMSLCLSDVCSSWICLAACLNAPCWPEMSERDTRDSCPCLTKSWTAANFCTTSTSKQHRSWVRVLNVIVRHFPNRVTDAGGSDCSYCEWLRKRYDWEVLQAKNLYADSSFWQWMVHFFVWKQKKNASKWVPPQATFISDIFTCNAE